MPLMHSEDLADQDLCVALFRALADALQGRAREVVEYSWDYAALPRDIIARWGRFPHRNAVLGRASTDAEREFLTQGAPRTSRTWNWDCP